MGIQLLFLMSIAKFVVVIAVIAVIIDDVVVVPDVVEGVDEVVQGPAADSAHPLEPLRADVFLTLSVCLALMFISRVTKL